MDLLSGCSAFYFLWLSFLSLAPAPVAPVRETTIARGVHFTRQEFRAGENSDHMEITSSWALTRGADGSVQVAGVERVQWRSGRVTPWQGRYRLRLSASLQVLAIPQLELPGGTLSCELGEAVLGCRKNGKTASLAIAQPYDLYLGNVWLLAGIARRAAGSQLSPTAVRLVITDEPFGLGAFTGTVRFLGSREHRAAGRSFAAKEYLLEAEPFPSYRILLSAEGIPLVVEALEEEKARTELVEFEQLAPF